MAKFIGLVGAKDNPDYRRKIANWIVAADWYIKLLEELRQLANSNPNNFTSGIVSIKGLSYSIFSTQNVLDFITKTYIKNGTPTGWGIVDAKKTKGLTLQYIGYHSSSPDKCLVVDNLTTNTEVKALYQGHKNYKVARCSVHTVYVDEPLDMTLSEAYDQDLATLESNIYDYALPKQISLTDSDIYDFLKILQDWGVLSQYHPWCLESNTLAVWQKIYHEAKVMQFPNPDTTWIDEIRATNKTFSLEEYRYIVMRSVVQASYDINLYEYLQPKPLC